MRYSCLFVLLVIPAWLNGAEAGTKDSSYIILAPNVFRAGQMFNVKVTILNTTSPVNVTAGIIDRYKNTIVSKSEVFHPGTARELHIKVPGMVTYPGYYLFFAKGSSSSGLRFYHNTYLRFKRKQMSIYVQTDKGIYKPGQTVHMRIFALFLNLTSYTGKMTVSVVDPNIDKMAHWVDVQGRNGIIKKDFTLSTQTVMGKWRIHVKASSESFYREFEVNKYVLPKFEVSITLPPYMLKKDTKVLGQVTSKYTYGKGVKGTVELEAYFSKSRRSIKQQLNLDETAPFSFEMQEIKDLFHSTYTRARESYLYQYSRYPLKIAATVTDKLTGKTMHKKQSVTFHLSDVKLEFPSYNPTNFKPGLPFVILLKVTKPNGASHHPEFLRSMTIYIKTKHNWRDNAAISEHHPSPDGIIVITKDVPSNAVVINIEAEYRYGSRSISKAWFSATKSLSPSNSFIQLSTSTPSVKSGESINCQVSGNFPLSTCMYVVLSRGNIRQTGTGNIQDNGYNATFRLTSQPIMSPSARIVVYSLTSGGEIVVDSLTISISNPFNNQVSLKFSNDTLRPGDRVKLVAKATAGSHVAFLAIDKSVLLMKKDNDISHSQVLRDLQSYSTGSSLYYWWDLGSCGGGCRFPFYAGGVYADAVFKNSGLIVFSDGLIYKQPWSFRGGPVADDEGPELESGVKVRSRTRPGSSATRVRSFFPETWIWADVNASLTGKAEISATVPDTMTSWVASAFAISPTTGFGIAALKPKLKVFQPFFISLDLPYSVIQGEEVAIKVLLFNYLKEEQQVTVTFKASKHWSSINNINVRGSHYQQAADIVELVTVPAGQGKDIAFPIIPTSLGTIPLTVYARSSLASDAVRRTLLVEPEGIPQQYSYSLMIDVNATSSFTKTLGLSLPVSVVHGSAHVKVTLIGDILGSSFNNIDDLLRMPYGCGEQNMINFAPNIFILKYLTSVNRVTSNIKRKAQSYMMQGYQREQTYRHKDGSYSAFGERDKEGSMWLTAFVVKSFAQARKYIYIDDTSLDLSLRWMVQKQNKNGSFPRVGYVIHTGDLTGGLKGELPLTAYVAIALSEARSPSELVNLARYLAVRYLEMNLNSVIISKDAYALAITAYALKLENSASSDKALLALLAVGIRKGTTLHWSNSKKNVDKSAEFLPYYRPRSADIEITAYALLTLALYKDFRNGLPVVRWLSQQRNSLGGYSSTQDTVLGIQAMSEFAALIYSPNLNFHLTLTHSAASNFKKTFTVNSDNALILQQVLIPKVKGKLSVTAKGHGIGLLQVGVTYHVTKAPVKSNFDLFVKILNETSYYVEAQTCARWKGDGEASPMAVVEMGVMSGFSTDEERVTELLDDKSLALKRIDFQEKKVIFYFDQISKSNASCIPIRFERKHAVGKGKPVPAVVYDYYSPENRAEALYSSDQLKDVNVCRVCSSCVGCDIKNLSNPPTNINYTTRTPNNCSSCPLCEGCKNVTKPNESESRNNSSPGFIVSLPMTLYIPILALMSSSSFS